MADNDDEAAVFTSSVWADTPSHNNDNDNEDANLKSVSSQFDEFDPFKPDARVVDPEQEEREAPPTPVKSAPPPPNKEHEESPASAIHDLSTATGVATPTKGLAVTSQPMTPATSSSSGLSQGLATIASAFRRRDRTASTSSTPPTGSHTPAGKLAPAVLIIDKDETEDMHDSEKEAPPAMPSLGQSNAHDGNEEAADTPTFDFNLFLEQMRSRPADPVAKYLRSFLKEFGKRTWGVNDQIRVINDFLDFIAVKMRENEVWKNQTDKEFDNAVEAMEKLVMNRVHHQTFVPALTDAQKATTQTDDLERDHVLTQRIKLFGWVNETHLDLKKHEDSDSFIEFAKQELRKVNSYKAPRDKLICILNCCKVIFGLMRHLAAEDGADTFIPFLILVVIRANPDHLISNVQYIQRFRNPERLAGENGYYLSSLNGAISFIETMDGSSLSNITQQEFERSVENAIQTLPPELEDKPAALPVSSTPLHAPQPIPPPSPSRPPRSPKKALRPSQYTGDEPQRSVSPAEATKNFIISSSDNLQKTVSKPLQALGRIFTEMGSDSEIVAGVPGPQQQLHQQQHPHHTSPQSAATARSRRPASSRSRSGVSVTSPTSPRRRRGYSPSYTPQAPAAMPATLNPPSTPSRTPSYQAGDFLADSVSAEEVQAEADRKQQASFGAKIETLVNIFPGIERETLEIVLLSNGEDVERTIEGFLEMA